MRSKRNFVIAFILIAMFVVYLPFQMVKADTSGDFEYSVLDGKATITEYKGSNINVVIPEKLGGYEVSAIANSAFLNQKNIKTVTFSSVLTSIGGYAFYGCELLEEISLPEGLRSLDINAFSGCKSLKQISLPEGCSSVGDYAFYNCKSLKSVTIPKSLNMIGSEVFLGCESLSSIEVHKDNLKFYSKNNVLFQKEGAGVNLYSYPAALSQKVYKVPDDVTAILDGAFYDVKNLEKVYIPKTVTGIAVEAFNRENSKLVICGEENGTAVRYAEEKGMKSSTETYIPVESLTMSESDIYITDKANMKFSLTATPVPANASETLIRWSSNDTSVATVENGVVTVKKNGLTIITAYCEDKYVTCSLWVQIPESEVTTPDSDGNQSGDNGTPTPTPTYTASFNSNSYEVFATAKVKASLTSTMPGDGFVTLKSSNTAVATVANDGTITGVKKGTATITATTKSGKTITATVKVSTPTVKLNVSSLPLQVKKSTTVLKVKSKLATDSIVKWTSSKTTIASVNKKTGKITAKKAGYTYITVTMKSGATAKCKIEVQKKAVSTTKITLNAKSKTLKLKGGSKTFQITVTKTPLTSLEKITYKSSNKKIATVSSKGKITAKKAGTATITVKAGKKTAKIKVTVKKK